MEYKPLALGAEAALCQESQWGSQAGHWQLRYTPTAFFVWNVGDLMLQLEL